MLPAGFRLRRAADFAAAVRRGPATSRAARATLVVHLLLPARPPPVDEPGSRPTPQVGVIVSRAVGPAVTRTRVRRRLRHAARGHLAGLPPHARLVIRALPPAGAAGYDRLRRDLDDAIADSLAAAARRDSGRAARPVGARSASPRPEAGP